MTPSESREISIAAVSADGHVGRPADAGLGRVLDSAPTTRRQFLKTSSMAGGGAWLASFSVARAADAGGCARIRLGLIGCGERGVWLAKMFREHGGYEIAGVADYFKEKVDAAAAKFQLKPEQTFTGLKAYERLIGNGGLDAVAIISPPYFHPMHARAAVDAGLNVYIAKPLSVDVPGCKFVEETGALATKKGLVFLVDFQTRVNEFYIEAIKRVHDGALGEMVFGQASHHCGPCGLKAEPGTPEARLKNWLFYRALSGDTLVEQKIHMIDVMNWAMNNVPPLRCTGVGSGKVRKHGDCWDYYTLVYEYPDKVGVTFSSRQFEASMVPEHIVRMYGSKGALMTEYGGIVMVRGAGNAFYRGGRTDALYQEGAQGNIRKFHELVRAKDASNGSVKYGVQSNLIAIMGRMAAYSGRTISWDDVLKSEEKYDGDLAGLKS
ncbi:MAG TPA: Gfo/Idh/MocA family oxidoreductase [Verrucomicrobiae bacterium]|nr:Gfo/Idh/MocA family oxidoreductase [Verrucomicrobiae bacterium]